MNLPSRDQALKLTALIGAAAVGTGAFGAHALQEFLLETGRLQTWETAVFYHLVHAVALLVLVLCGSWRPVSWCLLAAGLCVFSGSLYLLCLTQQTLLGAVTPIGGVLLIAGWLALLLKSRS